MGPKRIVKDPTTLALIIGYAQGEEIFDKILNRDNDLVIDLMSFRIPHFIDCLVLDLSFITPNGEDIPFPPTPSGKLCSLELLVRAQ